LIANEAINVVKIEVKCIHCDNKDVVKMGKQANGKPRCKCNSCNKTFQTHYTNNGAKPQTKQMILKLSTNGSGIRDISRVLNISTNTVLSVLKKQNPSKQT
jgi:transposase-like protein